jgi:Family of unknown function (DUF6252)
MTASVDGRSWTASRAAANLVAEITSGGTFSITGVEPATGTAISIGVEVLAGPDSYPLASIPGSSAAFIEPGAPGLAVSFVTTATHTGYLRVQAIDTSRQRIEGSFAFVASATDSTLRHIEAGHFTVAYRTVP